MRLGWGPVRAGRLQGRELFLDLENPVLQTMLDGGYDAYIYDYLARQNLDLTGAVAWDVGAEIGYHSLMLATYTGDQGKVLAFEPNPHNVERIRQQLARNAAFVKRIEIQHLALSDQDGEQIFRFSDNPALASIGYLDLRGHPGDRVRQEIYEQLQAVPVPTRSIDSLIASGAAVPRFIKLDVEGAEVEVLRGAKQLLAEHRPVLAVEVHNITCMFYVQAFLLAANYVTELIEEPGRSASRAFLWASPS